MKRHKLLRVISLVVVVSIMLSLYGCGDTKLIGDTEYDTYGLFNKEEKYNPKIKYRLVIGNVVWGIILCETIVAPIYFFGFSLYEPYRKAKKGEPKGSV